MFCIYRFIFHNFCWWTQPVKIPEIKKWLLRKGGIFSKLTIETQERRQCFLMSSSQWGRLYYTPCSRVFIVDFMQVNAHWVYSDFDVCVHVNCQRHIHEPCNIKTEHFAIILNGFWLFAVIAKRSILNFVGFLDPPLHCSKFAAHTTAWFKPKKHVYVFLHTLRESI